MKLNNQDKNDSGDTTEVVVIDKLNTPSNTEECIEIDEEIEE